jgi:hypothetical protein
VVSDTPADVGGTVTIEALVVELRDYCSRVTGLVYRITREKPTPFTGWMNPAHRSEPNTVERVRIWYGMTMISA